MTNYNDGKWHGYNGGECPVHPETVVHWVNFDGDSHEVTAGKLRWNDDESPVVAFRVIKEYKEPREFWLVLDADDHIATGFDNMDGAIKIANKWPGRTIIHVREVME